MAQVFGSRGWPFSRFPDCRDECFDSHSSRYLNGERLGRKSNQLESKFPYWYPYGTLGEHSVLAFGDSD
jgi:hypothetical protein